MPPITIEPHEIDGFADILRLEIYYAGDGFSAAEDRRAHIDYMRDLVEIDEAVKAAPAGEPVTIPASPTLLKMIREGGADAPTRLGEALTGHYPGHEEETMREAKGLLSLAQRLGLYEGVAI